MQQETLGSLDLCHPLRGSIFLMSNKSNPKTNPTIKLSPGARGSSYLRRRCSGGEGEGVRGDASGPADFTAQLPPRGRGSTPRALLMLSAPVHRPQRPPGSTHSSMRGLRPPEQLERPAGFPSSDKTRPDSPVPALQGPRGSALATSGSLKISMTRRCNANIYRFHLASFQLIPGLLSVNTMPAVCGSF